MQSHRDISPINLVFFFSTLVRCKFQNGYQRVSEIQIVKKEITYAGTLHNSPGVQYQHI
jgi:hypothetical protein